MKRVNGIRIIKRKNNNLKKAADKKTVAGKTQNTRPAENLIADRVKDWVQDFKAKKQAETARARQMFFGNTPRTSGT